MDGCLGGRGGLPSGVPDSLGQEEGKGRQGGVAKPQRATVGGEAEHVSVDVLYICDAAWAPLGGQRPWGGHLGALGASIRGAGPPIPLSLRGWTALNQSPVVGEALKGLTGSCRRTRPLPRCLSTPTMSLILHTIEAQGSGTRLVSPADSYDCSTVLQRRRSRGPGSSYAIIPPWFCSYTISSCLDPSIPMRSRFALSPVFITHEPSLHTTQTVRNVGRRICSPAHRLLATCSLGWIAFHYTFPLGWLAVRTPWGRGEHPAIPSLPLVIASASRVW